MEGCSSRTPLFSKFKGWLFKEKSETSAQILEKKSNHEVKKPVRYGLRELKIATNNFSEDNKIGSGGFGDVFKGIIDGREVAVKKLNGNSVNEESDIEKEVSLLSSLKNDNLVMLLGFCCETRIYMLVYEFVANGDIRQFLKNENKRRTLDWQTRFDIIKGIANGLCYLHHYPEKKIIHCDLKPENILLDKHNNAKIADFGLSRIVDLSKSHISLDAVKGTPGYIAPETICYPMHCSTKSDIFSFGLLILEMVVGCTISQYAKEKEGAVLAHVIWKKWIDTKPLEIIDTCLLDNYSEQEVHHCIHIGLLCVQNDRNKRPSIEHVLEMLNNHFDLEKPSSPGFYRGRPDQVPIYEDSEHSDELEYATLSKTYHLKDLEIATNKFSAINMLNKDSQYEGYMGTLDGQKVYIEKYSWEVRALDIIRFKTEKKGKNNHKMELLLPNLQHPNVLQYFGYCFEKEGALLLVSEYPHRGSLAEYLNHSNDAVAQSKNDLDLGTRLKIIKGLANGLCYLHNGLQDKAILHTNLKPSNILLDDDWNAKISNYCFAWILDDNHLDAYCPPPGTMAYIAPELMNCKGQLEDPVKSDVYNLGMVMLEILVGWEAHTYNLRDGQPCDLENDVRKHWKNRTLREIIDPFLATLDEQREVLRCFQIGLLCIERDPDVRLNAQEVVQMLSSNETLPVPADPANPLFLRIVPDDIWLP